MITRVIEVKASNDKLVEAINQKIMDLHENHELVQQIIKTTGGVLLAISRVEEPVSVTANGYQKKRLSEPTQPQDGATTKQVNYLKKLMADNGVTDKEIDVYHLSKRQAGIYINQLRNHKFKQQKPVEKETDNFEPSFDIDDLNFNDN